MAVADAVRQAVSKESTIKTIKEACEAVSRHSGLGGLCRQFLRDSRDIESVPRFSKVYNVLVKEIHSGIAQPIPTAPCLSPGSLSEPPTNMAEAFVQKVLTEVRYLTSLLAGRVVNVPQELYESILHGPEYRAEWEEAMRNETNWANYEGLEARIGTDVGTRGGFGWRDSVLNIPLFKQLMEEGFQNQTGVCLSTDETFGDNIESHDTIVNILRWVMVGSLAANLMFFACAYFFRKKTTRNHDILVDEEMGPVFEAQETHFETHTWYNRLKQWLPNIPTSAFNLRAWVRDINTFRGRL